MVRKPRRSRHSVSLLRRQQFREALAVRQILQFEHSIDERGLLRPAQGVAGELAEFVDDLVFRRKKLLAAARRLARLALDRAVAEVNIDAHLVAERRAERGDGGIVHDLDLARELRARTVVDCLRLELVDEHVAFDQQRRDAERQVELRRGQSLGPVRPADVIDGDLRSLHHDLVELIERERAAAGEVADGVERGVVAADAGIELERDTHGLEALAEPGAQLGEIEAILRARERGAEAAIGRLEHVDDAGEALLGEQRGVEPALRRPPGMHALDHGAVLRRHQPRRLGPRNAERMDRLAGGEAQAARGAGGGGVDAEGGAGMPALADMLLPHAFADAGTDLVAGDDGGEKLLAAESGVALRHRDQRRQRDGAHMQHPLAVDVVELEAVHLRAVDQRGVRGGELEPRAPDRGRARCIERPERPLQDSAPFEIGAIDRAAERVEDQKLDALAHLRGNALVGEPGDELGDPAGMHVVRTGMLGHDCSRSASMFADVRADRLGSRVGWAKAPGTTPTPAHDIPRRRAPAANHTRAGPEREGTARIPATDVEARSRRCAPLRTLPRWNALYWGRTAIQSRSGSFSRFCRRSNISSVPAQPRVSSKNFSRNSDRSSGRAGVPLKSATERASTRPSRKLTVTSAAKGVGRFLPMPMVTRSASPPMCGSASAAASKERGSRGSR